MADDRSPWLEPLRSNLDVTTSLISRAPRQTYQVPTYAIPYWLLKLYRRIPYTAEDPIPRLEASHFSSTNTVNDEDPMVISTDLFSYGPRDSPDIFGIIQPGRELSDEVVSFVLDHLQSLYRDTVASAYQQGVGVRLYGPAESQGLISPSLSISDRVTTFVNLTNSQPRALLHVFVVPFHYHYLTCIYSLEEVTFWVYSSFGMQHEQTAELIRLLRALFDHELLNSLNCTIMAQPCETQGGSYQDINNCGLYALYNAQRLLHSLTLRIRSAVASGGEVNLMGIGLNLAAQGTDLAQVLPQLRGTTLVTMRDNLRNAFFATFRQALNMCSFCDRDEMFMNNPRGLSDASTATALPYTSPYKAYMDPGRARDAIAMRQLPAAQRYRNLPLDGEVVEAFAPRPDSLWAALEQHWGQDDVAGVIMRLPQVDADGTVIPGVYKPVEYGQHVLLCKRDFADRVRRRITSTSRPSRAAVVPETTLRNNINAALNRLSPIVTERARGGPERGRNKFAALFERMMCALTPKLLLFVDTEGNTWAKQGWMSSRSLWEDNCFTINGISIGLTPAGSVKLPEFALINTPGDVNSAVRYLWIQKWPQCRNSPVPRQLRYRPLTTWDLCRVAGNLYPNSQVPSDISYPTADVLTAQGTWVDPPVYDRRGWPIPPSITPGLDSCGEVSLAPAQSRRLPVPQGFHPSQRRLYLKFLLEYMEGSTAAIRRAQQATVMGPTASEQEQNPLHGHIHHHHCPIKVIRDHHWRMNVYTYLQVHRFPWPANTQPTENATTLLELLDQGLARGECAEDERPYWALFRDTLRLGELALSVWEPGERPAEPTDTMMCMSGSCEGTRRRAMEARNRMAAENYTVGNYNSNDIRATQVWDYGTDQGCPADCPLRQYDCPADCNQRHLNALGMYGRANVSRHLFPTDPDRDLINPSFPISTREVRYWVVRDYLRHVIPDLTARPPPPSWRPRVEPEGADGTFWNRAFLGNEELTESRIRVCEMRLRAWFALPKQTRDIFSDGTRALYFLAIEQIFTGADWHGDIATQANARINEEIQHMQENEATETRVVSLLIRVWHKISQVLATRDNNAPPGPRNRLSFTSQPAFRFDMLNPV
ncbi:hypothetical protein BDZ91DRAFT_847139 [Kalaharituber pfeilii]|nr:hypothetical protein BDZ91DRAFT_847139 [Kalaharituber pfeilii]